MSLSPKPLNFGAAVKTNPRGTLRGNFQCTVTPYGVHFKQGKKLEFLIPVGTPTEYVNANRLRIHLPDYQIEMMVTRFGSYTFRLARDIAGFLNRQIGPPQPYDYTLSWPLLVVALLPVGIPLMTRGGAIPGAIAGALVMVTYGMLQNENWALPARVAASLGVSVLAYAAFLGMVLSAAGSNPF